MNSNHSIENLFLSFQRGEERGFSHYFHLHYKSLQFFASRIVKNRPLAEDIVADSFVKLFEKRVGIQSEATIKGFLYTTVRNACLDKLEQQKIRSVHHRQVIHIQEKQKPPHIEELIRTETIALVMQAIEELSPSMRKVFQLHYVEGLNYDEIAKLTGRSKETIRKQKQQGLLALRGKLLPVILLIICDCASRFG